LPAAF